MKDIQHNKQSYISALVVLYIIVIMVMPLFHFENANPAYAKQGYSSSQVDVPEHEPVNVCGNSINDNGNLNPAFGGNCSN